MINTKVSVVITTYKRPDSLHRAIMSVLGQDYSNLEIIVVDDNNDGDIYRKQTEELMAEFKDNPKVLYIKHRKNSNGAVARNTAVRRAKGLYITFLDDDDFFMPNRITKLVDAMNTNRKAGVAYSGVGFIYKERLVGIRRPKDDIDHKLAILCQQSFFGTGSNIFCKTSLVREIGGFDERFLRHQDMEFMIRLIEKVDIISVDEVLVIKCKDSRLNVPNYDKLKDVKDLFIKKFEYLISSYDSHNRNEIVQENYTELIAAAILARMTHDLKKYPKNHIFYGTKLSIASKIRVAIMVILTRFPILNDLRYLAQEARIFLLYKYDENRIQNFYRKINKANDTSSLRKV